MIEEHNYFTKIIDDLNKLYMHIIFNVYFMEMPSLLMLIYGSHHEEASWFSNFGSALITLLATPLLYLMSLNTRLINSAQSPYCLIFSYLTRVKRIRLRNKLKLMTYLERLSGPDIGFYCYDLFPLNSWEFYELVAICGTNYLLIISLL